MAEVRLEREEVTPVGALETKVDIPLPLYHLRPIQILKTMDSTPTARRLVGHRKMPRRSVSIWIRGNQAEGCPQVQVSPFNYVCKQR
jgi:hypothetical protein